MASATPGSSRRLQCPPETLQHACNLFHGPRCGRPPHPAPSGGRAALGRRVAARPGRGGDRLALGSHRCHQGRSPRCGCPVAAGGPVPPAPGPVGVRPGARPHGLAGGPGHGPDLPGQPGPQLRPGRAGHRPHRPGGRPHHLQRPQLVAGRPHRPARRRRARRGGRGGHHPTLHPGPPPHPHGRHHRAVPAADLRLDHAPPPLGREPGRREHRHPHLDPALRRTPRPHRRPRAGPGARPPGHRRPGRLHPVHRRGRRHPGRSRQQRPGRAARGPRPPAADRRLVPRDGPQLPRRPPPRRGGGPPRGRHPQLRRPAPRPRRAGAGRPHRPRRGGRLGGGPRHPRAGRPLQHRRRPRRPRDRRRHRGGHAGAPHRQHPGGHRCHRHLAHRGRGASHPGRAAPAERGPCRAGRPVGPRRRGRDRLPAPAAAERPAERHLHRRLRPRRGVGRDPHRVGRAGVAGPDVVRRRGRGGGGPGHGRVGARPLPGAADGGRRRGPGGRGGGPARPPAPRSLPGRHHPRLRPGVEPLPAEPEQQPLPLRARTWTARSCSR